MAEAKAKELKELVVGGIALTMYVKKLAKDGLDLGDGAALASRLVSDEVFRGKLVDAGKGADDIVKEFKKLSLGDVIEILLAAKAEIDLANSEA